MTDRREPKRMENPDAAGWPQDEFTADLGHGEELVDLGDTTEETRPLGNHEAGRVRERVGDRADELTVLREGTQLRQGATYVDLERLDDGPFVALGGQQAERGQLIVSKRLVNYEAWNALVGQDDNPRVERPPGA